MFSCFLFQSDPTRTLRFILSLVFEPFLDQQQQKLHDRSACSLCTGLLHGENHLTLPATNTVLWWSHRGGEIRMQRGKATCPRSHIWQGSNQGSKLGRCLCSSRSQIIALDGSLRATRPCTVSRPWRRRGRNTSIYVMSGRALTIKDQDFVFVYPPFLL